METMAITQIDEEINKHLLLVSELCAERNSFLLIFRLPTEILARIFTHGARDYYEGDNYPSFRVPDWVNVSYVCHRWRYVALNCPTLWTYHFTVSLRWTEELLARSKQAPLKIRIQSYDDLPRGRSWWLDLLEKVLNHAERIQELRLHIPGTLFSTMSMLSLYAPHLQILDLCSRSNQVSEWSLAINHAGTPSLHTLRLVDCSLPWHSLDLSRVTTLFLCRVPAQNIVEFVTTLNRMQAITVLHLERALSTARGFLSSGTYSVYPRVTLPYLTRLLVLASISTVVALLSCMNIPLKTQVRLEIILEDGSSANDYYQLPPILAQRFSQSEGLPSLGPTIRSLVVRTAMNRSAFVVATSERNDCDPVLLKQYPPRECNAPLTILVRREEWMATSDMDRVMGDICCSIPSIYVQTLYAVEPPLSFDFWRKTLGHLCGLRCMKLKGGSIPDLVSLLALPADERLVTVKGHVTGDHGLTGDHTFVPALEELELHSIRFGSGVGFSSKSLLDALSTRKARHPRLTMIRCIGAEGDELESTMDDDASPHFFYLPSRDEMSFFLS